MISINCAQGLVTYTTLRLIFDILTQRDALSLYNCSLVGDFQPCIKPTWRICLQTNRRVFSVTERRGRSIIPVYLCSSISTSLNTKCPICPINRLRVKSFCIQQHTFATLATQSKMLNLNLSNTNNDRAYIVFILSLM